MLLLRKNLERLQKRDTERYETERRLGKRRLANLEHDLKIARKTTEDNKFKPIFPSRSADLLRVPATLSQLAKSIEDSVFFCQFGDDHCHWASFEKRHAFRSRSFVQQGRASDWPEAAEAPLSNVSTVIDDAQDEKIKAIQGGPGRARAPRVHQRGRYRTAIGAPSGEIWPADRTRDRSK